MAPKLPEIKLKPLSHFRALAEEMESDAAERAFENEIAAHYRHLRPTEVVDMWERQVNEDGRKLSEFERMALHERWWNLFGTFPLFASEDGSGIPAPVPRPDNSGDRLQNQRDDTMLHTDDAVRMCGVSESRVYRAILERRFPKPTWLPTGRRGWPAYKVKEWQASLHDDARLAAAAQRQALGIRLSEPSPNRIPSNPRPDSANSRTIPRSKRVVRRARGSERAEGTH
jgi:predicted DNA-binding transcriptional regulator AlpA